MTAPFTRHDPPAAPQPLVLDSPHSGESYPDDFDHALPRAHVRQAEDTHVARLWRGALAHGATLIEANFPRAYVDPNRSLTDVDPALFDGEAWPGPVNLSRKTEQGIGLVWRLARGGAPLYARKLTVDEVQRRIANCYVPYHVALDRLLDERHAAFGAVWHINCHSMPAVGDAWSDDPGHERADFVLGDRDGTTCAPAFTECVAATLQSYGYRVALNDPYKGVELVRKHGRPSEHRHSLQIEIKRTLYMDEVTLVPNDGYQRIERDLARLAAAIGNFVARSLNGKPGLGIRG